MSQAQFSNSWLTVITVPLPLFLSLPPYSTWKSLNLIRNTKRAVQRVAKVVQNFAANISWRAAAKLNLGGQGELQAERVY